MRSAEEDASHPGSHHDELCDKQGDYFNTESISLLIALFSGLTNRKTEEYNSNVVCTVFDY